MRSPSARLVIVGVVGLLVAVSCTGDDDGATPASTGATPTTSGTDTSAPTTAAVPSTTPAPSSSSSISSTPDTLPDEIEEVSCPEAAGERGGVPLAEAGDPADPEIVVVRAADSQRDVAASLADGGGHGNAAAPCENAPACYELADATSLIVVYPTLVGREVDGDYDAALQAIRNTDEYQAAIAVVGGDQGVEDELIGRDEQPVAGVFTVPVVLQGEPDSVVRQLITEDLPRTRDLRDPKAPEWIFDLIYVNSLAPNNGFHPWDDPTNHVDARIAQDERVRRRPDENGVRVAVVDSPTPSDVTYGYQTFTDATRAPVSYLLGDQYRQGAGHGPFVAQMIEDLSGAEVTLTPIEQFVGAGDPATVEGARAPQLFDDVELLRAITDALGNADDGPAILNLSLGRPRCSGSTEDGSALAAALDVLTEPADTLVVSAAGNDGEDRAHFPAAIGQTSFRRPSSSPDRFVAVGSAVESGGTLVRDCFSNFGSWVTGWEPGYKQAGIFPGTHRAALWSGTSFSAPQFTAAVVNAIAAAAATGTTTTAPSEAARLTTSTPPADPTTAPPACP